MQLHISVFVADATNTETFRLRSKASPFFFSSAPTGALLKKNSA
ncbi:hypothetical protein [Bacillus cereus group sp. BfR-BA-01495]|nr:hypothetical protein [Bacillus cereus group sp. BfR-BA-01495]